LAISVGDEGDDNADGVPIEVLSSAVVDGGGIRTERSTGVTGHC
jgi:hypothetical protein